MGSLLVIDRPETVEGLLVGSPMSCRRGGRLGLQRARDAFMAAVLFGMTGGNPLRNDAQLHPVERQGRKSGNGSGSKGWPVVGANGPRQTILPERRLEDGEHLFGVGFFHRLAAQQIAARRIADGQRIDALTGQRQKPPLEISTPKLIRFYRLLKWLRVRRGLAKPSPGHRQPFSLEQRADGAGRRQHQPRLLLL